MEFLGSASPRLGDVDVDVDGDLDGDLDLLAGSSTGGVHLVENTAGKGNEMNLGKIVQLVVPARQSEARWVTEKGTPSDSTRVVAHDLSGDGKLDVIVGDRATVKIPRPGVTREVADVKLKKWNKNFSELSRKLVAAEDADNESEIWKVSGEMQRHRKSREKILKEGQTGFV